MSETKDNPLLAGIRVVEAATMIMVPSVGAILSDFGAEVIKIETPGTGDRNRDLHTIPGMPTHELEYCYFLDNRNKKSIALNLKSEEGMKVLHELLGEADVFLTSFRIQVLERLGLTYNDLKDKYPRLICVHGTGYGDVGEEARRPAYDVVSYWARSGLEASIFPLEGWPGPIPAGTGDHPSGMALLAGVMGALYGREQTGRGTRVTSSLLANGAWTNGSIIQARLCDAKFHPRRPREDPYNYTSVYYRSSDGRTLKMAIPDYRRQWPHVCKAMDREDLIDDPNFATHEARMERMGEIVAMFDAVFAKKDLEYWKATLTANDIPYSVVANYDDVAEDEQMKANNVFLDVEHPKYGKIRTINSPIEIAGHAKITPRAAPELGANTREVLARLGYSEAAIESMIEKGAAEAAE